MTKEFSEATVSSWAAVGRESPQPSKFTNFVHCYCPVSVKIILPFHNLLSRKDCWFDANALHPDTRQ